jgi:DNA primase
MALASDFAQTLKQQADIVRVVGDYVSLKKAGAQNYSGLCPFHKEKTPSFSVHATRQFFHCFGCGKSGDVFKFVQEIENISFPEAIRMVAQKMGVAMPKATFNTEAEARDARIRTALLEIHERAVSFFQECLWRSEGARAREYLIGRGLDEATIRKFRIGFAPDSGFLLRDRLKNEFSEEVLRESGLFSWKENASSAVGRTSYAGGPKNRSLDSAGQSPSGSSGVARDDSGKGNGVADDGRQTTDDGSANESREPLPCTPSSATGSCSPLRTTAGA